MKILKQGNKNLELVGKCAICNCEFILDNKDKYEERKDGSKFYKCPNCNRDTLLTYEPIKELTMEEFLLAYAECKDVRYDLNASSFEFYYCYNPNHKFSEYRRMKSATAYKLYNEYLKTHKISK